MNSRRSAGAASSRPPCESSVTVRARAALGACERHPARLHPRLRPMQRRAASCVHRFRQVQATAWRVLAAPLPGARLALPRANDPLARASSPLSRVNHPLGVCQPGHGCVRDDPWSVSIGPWRVSGEPLRVSGEPWNQRFTPKPVRHSSMASTSAYPTQAGSPPPSSSLCSYMKEKLLASVKYASAAFGAS